MPPAHGVIVPRGADDAVKPESVTNRERDRDRWFAVASRDTNLTLLRKKKSEERARAIYVSVQEESILPIDRVCDSVDDSVARWIRRRRAKGNSPSSRIEMRESTSRSEQQRRDTLRLSSRDNARCLRTTYDATGATRREPPACVADVKKNSR